MNSRGQKLAGDRDAAAPHENIGRHAKLAGAVDDAASVHMGYGQPTHHREPQQACGVPGEADGPSQATVMINVYVPEM